MTDPEVIAPPVKELPIDLKDPKLYINRELSMLEFQKRVLEEAQDETNPLLERIKFLAIVGSNLDEFFMVRVSGLKKQVDAGVLDLPPDGMTPAEQLAAIRKITLQLMAESRTGYDSSGASITGSGNCMNWSSTSSSDYGVSVKLSRRWTMAVRQFLPNILMK